MQAFGKTRTPLLFLFFLFPPFLLSRQPPFSARKFLRLVGVGGICCEEKRLFHRAHLFMADLYRRVLTQSTRDWTVPKSRKVRISLGERFARSLAHRRGCDHRADIHVFLVWDSRNSILRLRWVPFVIAVLRVMFVVCFCCFHVARLRCALSQGSSFGLRASGFDFWKLGLLARV